MFKHLQSYIDEIIPFMVELNPNINWSEMLNSILTYDTEKQLSKIKTFLWTDKDIETVDQSIEDEFVRYMSLIFNDMLKGETTVNKVYIISPPDKDNELVIADVVRDIILKRFNIINNILKLYNIDFVCTNIIDSIPKESVLFPTCSIMYKNTFDLSSYKVIKDGYYNLYTDDIDKEKNLFKITILELANNPEITPKTVIEEKWNFVKIGLK